MHDHSCHRNAILLLDVANYSIMIQLACRNYAIYRQLSSEGAKLDI
jgi:hypothetical protein